MRSKGFRRRDARLAPGSRVDGRYQIKRLIGRGSMGAVYEATDLVSGERRAIKVMVPELADDKRARHRFEREATLGSRIPSRGVVHTLHAGTDPERGLRWIAMEYVAGQTLDEWLSCHPSRRKVSSAIEQLLRAVAAAHSLGIVHRDLKPSNILSVPPDEPRSSGGGTPVVKVLDFGVAKSLHSSTLSGTEEGLGAPMWTAPEQAREGHAPMPNADVWSLGLLVFWLLTGKVYWLSANRAEAPLADMVLELVSRPLLPASVRAGELGCAELLPHGFDEWFSRCVNRDPAERFQNAGAALDALAPMLGLQARRRGFWPKVRAVHRAATPRTVAAAACLTLLLVAAIAWLLVVRAGTQ